MIDKLVEIASQSGYTLELRKDSEQIWVEAANLFAKNQHISFDYTNENITYQLEYFVGNNFNVSDLSIIIEKDGTHKAIWPIALMKGSKNNITTLGQRGILPPVFTEVSSREEKRLIRLCTEIIRTIVVGYEIDSWVMKDSFFGRDKISEWHRRLLSEGGKVQVFHELYLKLDKDYKKIREGYRDSYKSLINKGNRIWDIQVLDSVNSAIWQEFKELHKSVAGKQTRSDLSWEIQHDFIINGKAFLVYILDESGVMVGGGYFTYNEYECIYSVGAYKRELFDEPLGHCIQDKAISIMINKNIPWYKIGERPYPADYSSPSEKEISIGVFKEGFASHIIPVLLIESGAGGKQ